MDRAEASRIAHGELPLEPAERAGRRRGDRAAGPGAGRRRPRCGLRARGGPAPGGRALGGARQRLRLRPCADRVRAARPRPPGARQPAAGAVRARDLHRLEPRAGRLSRRARRSARAHGPRRPGAAGRGLLAAPAEPRRTWRRSAAPVPTSCPITRGLMRAAEEAGLTPLHSSVASEADWDRYEWRLILNAERWAAAHPADPGAELLRERAAPRSGADHHARWARDARLRARPTAPRLSQKARNRV